MHRVKNAVLRAARDSLCVFTNPLASSSHWPARMAEPTMTAR
jgi:hypothetical protein